jgi:hypothetical protein
MVVADRSGVHHALTAYQLGSHTLPLIPSFAARDWMLRTDKQFANRCLPMLIANQSGWLILNDVPFTAVWSGGDGVRATSVSYDPGPASPSSRKLLWLRDLDLEHPFVFRTPLGFNLKGAIIQILARTRRA